MLRRRVKSLLPDPFRRLVRRIIGRLSVAELRPINDHLTRIEHLLDGHRIQIEELFSRTGEMQNLLARVQRLEQLCSRVDRIELSFAGELERIRYSELDSTYSTDEHLHKLSERTKTVVERRYGVLSDRLRILQRQFDLDRVRFAEVGRLKGTIPSIAALESKSTEIVRRLDDVRAHVDALEAMRSVLEPQVRTTAADVATVNARLRATPFMAASIFPVGEAGQRNGNLAEFDYVGFEQIFRGPEEMIKERQRPYLRFLRPGSRVVDLGCGRGEFLALATEAGADVVGVDLNSAMVERSRKLGFNVHESDALAFLRDLEPLSIDVVFSAQFVEHVDPQALYELFALSRRALLPGGIFIAETVNPQSLEALRTFYVDLTHVKPLFPEVLAFFARSAGFTSGEIFYPNGAGFDEEAPWNQGEYALIATTHSSTT